MKPHKHAELIKAWADGAQIEYKNPLKVWMEVDSPDWSSWVEYRIKPESKSDYVRYIEMNIFCGYVKRRPESNMKVVFDGETGELKSAEVLK